MKSEDKGARSISVMEMGKRQRIKNITRRLELEVESATQMEEFLSLCWTSDNPLLQGLKNRSEDEIREISFYIRGWYKAIRS